MRPAAMRGGVMYRNVTDRNAIKFIATKPTMVITTRHATGVVNAGVFGAYTNLSPEHIGAAIAADTHTYANILRTREFAICVPGADLVKAVRILADDIPPDISEVTAAGLTLKDGITIATPGIAECMACVECVFDRAVPVARHHFIIGKVTGGWIRESCLDTDGGIDIFKARVIKDFKYPQPLYMLPGDIIKG
jgi:flavin reductase (DIM6/NTAB) family NADH-FMN oxidoreductase RutF